MKSRERNPIPALLTAMLVSIAVTVLLLLLVTILVYNTNVSGSVTGILIVAIYVLGPFSGAFVLGKMVKKKRYLWGMLLGILYFCVFVLVSSLTSETETAEIREYIQVLLAVLPGGILGGMFS